jgi:TusA-related sulfurtransferase
MSQIASSQTLDVRGEVCPVPDVETKMALKKMKAGEVLEVITDYAMSRERIPEVVKNLGHEVVEVLEDAPSEWRIFIKVCVP